LLNAIICCLQLNTQGVLGWFPVSGFLVINAVGLRSMYFVVMPRVNLIVILMTYVRYLYSINCPTIICLPSMCYLSYGETPLVNYGPRSHFLYIAILFYFYSLCLLSCITIILLPLDTLNPLFTANRWDWQPHRKLGAKFLVVLCAGFMLLLGEDTPTSSLSGAIVWSVAKLASITFWSLAFSYWFDSTLVSQLREKLLRCSSYLPLRVPNGLLLHAIKQFSSAIAGEKEDFCKGSLARTMFYFLFVLLYFIFACIFLSKIQKN
jgi:hypothetical protein